MKSAFYGLVFSLGWLNVPALSQELVIAAPASLASIEPNERGDAGDVMWRNNVYDTLVGIDDDLDFVPELAVSWEYNGVGLLLRLRECTFTNGDALSAADVSASLRHAQDQGYFASLRIEVIDDNTIQVVAENDRTPLAAWLIYLPIIPRSWFDGDRDAFPPGTGPYRLVELRPSDRAIFERNTEWWGWTETDMTGTAERITLVAVGDQSAQVHLLSSGQVDLLWSRTGGYAEKGDETVQFMQSLAAMGIPATLPPGGIFAANRSRELLSIQFDWYGIKWANVQTSN
ncbi:ABC transporter substrate-binding protein [Mesorhizobium mediterraneum]|uniref:ABC transporter substrate-binding protein n=1 Tax=Mesorhizobium mediterraneum TaxID=43617 RepID=UPI001786B662|nr:ABC transporter substrate-binding protein [Mesorhizobium mediterraneum]